MSDSRPARDLLGMSKHAVEAFTDSLAQEMAPLGVQVSVVEPGNYNAEAELTIRKAIEQLVQLNEGQAYTYDREALVKMLDASLAKAQPRR